MIEPTRSRLAGEASGLACGVRGLPSSETPSARRSNRRVKKLSPDLRRKQPDFAREPHWSRRLIWRWREDPQFLRSSVQLAFILLCVWIGVEFCLFVQWGLSGGENAFVQRPPGVEGFLPISALISLNHWLQTGVMNAIHPAAVFILLAVLATSIVVKKAFCSWLCPIGTLSESLWMLGRKLFKRNIVLPRWLDYPARSLKYLLLFFFVYSIATMDVDELSAFIHSPYNRVADIKMYLFFAEISTFALWVLIGLVILSVIIKNFWCRFLCPYGALLGIFSWLSPLKITRNTKTCIDCALCTKACPADITVHRAGRVWSDECMSCLECVQICPVKNTLDMRVSAKGRPVSSWLLATLIAGVFIAVTGAAMLTGHWRNAISQEEYQRRFQQLDSPVYQHFRGKVPRYSPAD